MQKALLIAEKPDLMRQIEAVYKKHKNEIPYEIAFTSQRGHLITLMLPSEIDEEQSKWAWENLPFNPAEHGGWQYKVIEEKKTGKFLTTKERLENIKKEISSGKYGFVINAGDPDQEGELLIRIVLSYIGNTLPVKRFWTNDLTESHILSALLSLKDDDNEPMLTNLLQAAYGRQHSDYLFGMNISEAASLKMNGRVACGRVKTPLLAIVCKREDEIRNYVEKSVYGLQADYTEKFEGRLSKEGHALWFETKEEAEELKDSLGEKATVISYEEKETKTQPPRLFKLATLQIEAGKMGYNDKVTLDTIQKLYEQQYLSYPRTDCEYLSSNEDFKGILKALNNFYDEKIDDSTIEKVKHSSKWVNDKALEESGHSALRPTTKVPDISLLNEAEKNIYMLIVKRFIAIFLPPMAQKEVKLLADIDGNEFISSAKDVIDPGFTKFLNNTPASTKIPKKNKGDVLDVEDFKITTKTSEKPKRLTSPELIAICEKPGRYSETKKDFKIGTPATRSGIIRQLIDKDAYIEEAKEGKRTVLKPTYMGEKIISNLGDLSICKVDMTGEWEEKLAAVREGRKTLDELENEMMIDVCRMIDDIKEKQVEGLVKTIGKCPICEGDIVRSKNGFYCKECHVGIYKEFMSHKFTESEAEKLIKGESISVQLKKNDGTKWQQSIKYNFTDKHFEFVKEEAVQTDYICPECGKTLNENSKTLSCECGYTFWKTQVGHKFTAKEISNLFGGKTIKAALKKNDGTKWEQMLKLEKGKLIFVKETESSYKCPICGGVCTESTKAISCKCGLTVWKTVAEHTLTKKELKALFEKGDSGLIKGLKSKKGTDFDAHIVINKEQKKTEMTFA